VWRCRANPLVISPRQRRDRAGAAACRRTRARRSSRVGSAELHDPADLPGLLAVDGEGLFPARRARRDLCPQEAGPYRPTVRRAVVRVVAIELPAAVERTDRRPAAGGSRSGCWPSRSSIPPAPGRRGGATFPTTPCWESERCRNCRPRRRRPGRRTLPETRPNHRCRPETCSSRRPRMSHVPTSKSKSPAPVAACVSIMALPSLVATCGRRGTVVACQCCGHRRPGPRSRGGTRRRRRHPPLEVRAGTAGPRRTRDRLRPHPRRCARPGRRRARPLGATGRGDRGAPAAIS